MFTGIVSAVGAVTKTSGSRSGKNGSGGRVLEIKAPFRNVKRGESVAINGACLTVERIIKGGFAVRAIDTTLDRTLFGEYAAGRKVNL